MLTVEKSLLGKFDEHELAKCISAHGWQAALPDALKDHQLLLLSDQLRDLLAGKGWNSKHGDGSAALSLGLLLLSKAGASLPEDLSDRKSTRLNSSHLVISYAVFCLKKKNNTPLQPPRTNTFPSLKSTVLKPLI